MQDWRPSKLDISPSNCLCLDEASAVKNFLGKSQEEALVMYRERELLSCTEDLYYMGDKAFAYYLPPVADYLQEVFVHDHSEYPYEASMLLHIFSSRAIFDPVFRNKAWYFTAAELYISVKKRLAEFVQNYDQLLEQEKYWSMESLKDIKMSLVAWDKLFLSEL